MSQPTRSRKHIHQLCPTKQLLRSVSEFADWRFNKFFGTTHQPHNLLDVRHYGFQSSRFWLHGLTGSGKSTMATTLANRLLLQYERSNLDTVVRDAGIPIRCLPTYCWECYLYDSRWVPGHRWVSPRTQLHKLIVKPLQTIPSKFSKPIASILDALDECGAAESRETLLEALVDILVDIPRFVRIVIASRFDLLVQELDINSPSNARDTLDYI